MNSFLILCVIAYGLTQLFKVAKNNPGQSLRVASWITQLFRK